MPVTLSAMSSCNGTRRTRSAIEFEHGVAAGDQWARFTKTVTQKGKTKDYPAVLVLSEGCIVEENDDVDWCRSGDGSGTNDRVVPPFTMSGSEAIGRAYETKHMKEQQYECGFYVRTSDLDAKTPSNLVEWLYIDPIEKKLWFMDGDAWKSEPLPPAPK
jgi:hypothetical protein